MMRERYTIGHVLEDFMDDDREAIATHRARSSSLLDAFLPFGLLGANDAVTPHGAIPNGVLEMREARKRRDWATADAARLRVVAQGWQVRSLADGSVEWQRDYLARA